jgi:hypothetical protein
MVVNDSSDPRGSLGKSETLEIRAEGPSRRITRERPAAQLPID